MHALAVLLTVTSLGVEYGWHNLDGQETEYVIQIEPNLLELLRNGDEVVSEVASEVADVRRFRIRVGAGKLPRRAIGSPLTSTDASQLIVVEYGWHNPDGQGTEYIVQIDPKSLKLLRSGNELTSKVAAEVVNVRRFRILVGTGSLPRATTGSPIDHSDDPPPSFQPSGDLIKLPEPTPKAILGDVPKSIVQAQWQGSPDSNAIQQAKFQDNVSNPDQQPIDAPHLSRQQFADQDNLDSDTEIWNGGDPPNEPTSRPIKVSLPIATQDSVTGFTPFPDDEVTPSIHHLHDHGSYDTHSGSFTQPTAVVPEYANDNEFAHYQDLPPIESKNTVVSAHAGSEYGRQLPGEPKINHVQSNPTGARDRFIPAVDVRPPVITSEDVQKLHQVASHSHDPYEQPVSSEKAQSIASSLAPNSGQNSRTEKPWFLLTVALMALFASLGGNLYLGWITWDTHDRYQELATDLHEMETRFDRERRRSGRSSASNDKTRSDADQAERAASGFKGVG